MVSNEGKDRVMVLHIDETRYALSSHGQFECIQCHTTIDKVPHTGQRSVDCSTTCHQGDDAEPLPPDYPLAGFHTEEQSYILQLENTSSCQVCHQLYPHRENNLVRGFINMHTGFMACSVCHLKTKEHKGLGYRWGKAEKAVFQGEAYGTFFYPAGDAKYQSKGHIMRIEAYDKSSGRSNASNRRTDLSAAKKFLRQEKKMSPQKRTSRLEYFHRNIERKEISVACEKCHSTDPILDYPALGFNDRKTRQLTNLNLKGLVTKYKTFHLPRMFER